MIDWHKLVILYLAGREDLTTSTDIQRHLKDPKNDIEKSLPAIGDACKKSLSDVVLCHDQSSRNDDGTVRKIMFKYSLKTDFATLQKIVLEGTYLRGRGSESVFLQSKYLNDWMPKLENEFTTSFAKLKLSMFDIHNAGMSLEDLECARKINDTYAKMALDDTICPTATTEARNHVHRMFISDTEPIEFNDAEKKEIATTLRSNWSLLRFIVFYLSLDTEKEQKDLMLKIAQDTLKNSPAAIAKDAIIRLQRHIHDTNLSDFVQLSSILLSSIIHIVQDTGACDEWGLASDQRMWFLSMFAQIENMRNRYPFLFAD